MSRYNRGDRSWQGIRIPGRWIPATGRPSGRSATTTRFRCKGELPRELAGTLFRNGPNPQFDTPDAHWFVGDGMLHAFTLGDGKASYRNRWVRTPKFLAEHDAGRAIWSGKGFGGQRLPDAPPTPVTDAGVANTNVIWHAGKLLALEEAHLPTEIDPKTLDTQGYVDYARGIAGPVTAHPKIDPVTGELIFFGYSATGPFSTGMTYGAIATLRCRQPLRTLRCALRQHGARLHRDGRTTCCSRSCR